MIHTPDLTGNERGMERYRVDALREVARIAVPAEIETRTGCSDFTEDSDADYYRISRRLCGTHAA